MVEIVDGSKEKLVEIDTQIELLRRQIDDLEDQRAAFVKVIRVYIGRRLRREGRKRRGQQSIRIDLNIKDPYQGHSQESSGLMILHQLLSSD